MPQKEASFPYADIIDLPRPPTAHPKMSDHDRAGQFSPFASISDYGSVIAECDRVTVPRIILDEEAKAILDRKQALLSQTEGEPRVTVTYFVPDTQKEGGAYVTHKGCLRRIDPYERILLFTDGRRVSLDDVIDLSGPFEKELP